MIKKYTFSNSAMEKKIIDVKVADINAKDYNPRRGGLVMDNVDKLILAQEFPAIHLGYLDGELYVVDGYHRMAATNALQRDEIKAFITKYDTENEMKKQAFISNVNHGVMLSELDIALNIYDFYVIEKDINPAATLTDIITSYSIPIRRGRQLFFWSVLNKEILELDLSTIKDISRAEEYAKFITSNKEKIGQISELLKEDVRRFYYKYNYLPIPDLREAIDLQIKGKDYEEFQKEKREFEAEQEREEARIQNDIDKLDIPQENFERIEPEDEVDRNANVSYETDRDNEMIENINNSAQRISEEVKKAKESKKADYMSQTIESMSESVGMLNFMNSKGKVLYTHQDYETIQNVIDMLSDLVLDISRKLESVEKI